MDNYGLISLLPAIFVILFALYTKKTFEALILGSIFTFVIVNKGGFFNPWLDSLYEVMMDGDTVWVILTCGLFGSLIALLEKSRGSFGFSKLMLKYSNTQKKSLLATWILGIIIFVDDYLNVLTIGSSMRTVTDKHKIPREMLAYVIDSTGAPVCVLIPFSTWVIFFASVFAKQPELQHLGSGLSMYYHSLPYIFYGWTAVIVVPLVILGVIPIIGPMKKAYKRVSEGGNTYSEKSAEYNTEIKSDNYSNQQDISEMRDKIDIAESDMDGKLVNFTLPILLLVIITVWTGDLLIGVLASIAVGIVLYLPFKVMTFDDYSKCILGGFANMIPMLAIIIGAFTFQRAASAIGMADYVVETVQPLMSPQLFPAITFVVVSMLSFITGSNWGVPAVTVPIIAPLAIAVGANPYLALAAIVSGGTFGSHACFYSDCTVLTSMSARIDNMEHALTQFPYALISAGMATVLYLIFGFIM